MDSVNSTKLGHYTNIFMFLIFIIGAVITYIAWDIDAKLEPTKCTSATLKTCNKIVLCIGIMFITSALSFYLCAGSCANSIVGFHYKYYIGLLMLLSVILIVLGAIITSESSRPDCTNEGYPSAIWGLGTFILLSCLFYGYNNLKLSDAHAASQQTMVPRRNPFA